MVADDPVDPVSFRSHSAGTMGNTYIFIVHCEGMADADRETLRRQFIKAASVAGIAGMAGCTGGGGSGSSGNDSTGGGGDGNGSSGNNGNESTGSGNAAEIKHVAPGYDGLFSDDLAPRFNEAVSDVQVSIQSTTAESSSTRDYFVNQFVSQSSDFDDGMMDVIWPAEFAMNEWIEPVNDPEGYTDAMLETPVEAATIDGTLVGMPLFTDANGFYYRTDKLEEYGHDPPKTYTEVIEIAKDVLEKDDEIENGYIWQGGPNEGLTIMWLNWLWGMGGGVKRDGKLVVNSQKGVEALTHARELIAEHGVTPESVPSSSTDENRQTFQQGNTLFMRNWPYAVAAMSGEDSAVDGKFDVTRMPKQEGNSDANNSCLGGWNVFINSYSENVEAAQTFAQFFASKEIQRRLAVEHSRLPVREDVYNEEVFNEAPLVETFSEIANETSARPSTPKYTTFSSIVFTEANKALIGDVSPQKALDNAQSQIDSDVNDA